MLSIQCTALLPHVIILQPGKAAATESHFVSPALPLFYCVASTTRRGRKKMKRASTRGALCRLLQMLSQRLSRQLPPSSLSSSCLDLLSAFLCTKPSSTPNLSQLVGKEEFVIVVPIPVCRQQRIFHRYSAGGNLAIFLTLAQDWIISNYLGL